MSFNPIEISNNAGRPIVLYEFALGSTIWRYSAGPEDLQFAGHTYTQAPISDADPLAGPGALDSIQDRGTGQHQIRTVGPDTGLGGPPGGTEGAKASGRGIALVAGHPEAIHAITRASIAEKSTGIKRRAGRATKAVRISWLRVSGTVPNIMDSSS